MASTVTDVKDCSPVLTRPKVGGASLEANTQPVSSQVDVAYKGRSGWVNRERLPRATRRDMRKAKSLPTDLELHFYLATEFAWIPRTCDLLRQMTIKAKNYLYKYDLTEYSNEHIYKMIMKAVRSAMAIPPEEEALRATLKNGGVLEDMEKHSKLVTKGIAGRVGLFKTTKVLPAAK